MRRIHDTTFHCLPVLCIIALSASACVSAKHGASWPEDIAQHSACPLAEGDLVAAERSARYAATRYDDIDDLTGWMLGLYAQLDAAMLLHDLGEHHAAAVAFRAVLEDLDATSMWSDTRMIELHDGMRPMALTGMLMSRLAARDLAGARVDARLFEKLVYELDAERRDRSAEPSMATSSRPIDIPESAVAMYLTGWIWRLAGEERRRAEFFDDVWAQIAPPQLENCPPGGLPVCGGDGIELTAGTDTAELIVVVRSGLFLEKRLWRPYRRVDVRIDDDTHEAMLLHPFVDVRDEASLRSPRREQYWPPAASAAADWWLAHVRVPAGVHEIEIEGGVLSRDALAEQAEHDETRVVATSRLELAPGDWRLVSVRDTTPFDEMASAYDRPRICWQ